MLQLHILTFSFKEVTWGLVWGSKLKEHKVTNHTKRAQFSGMLAILIYLLFTLAPVLFI